MAKVVCFRLVVLVLGFAGLALAADAHAKGDPDTFCRALLQDDKVYALNKALAGLWLGEDLPEANDQLRAAFTEAMGDATAISPEVADQQFKWQMRTWVRIYYLFGHPDARFTNRLDADNQFRIEDLLWNYGRAKSTLGRADLKYVWFIQGSENHDLMDLGNAYLALQALAHLPEYAKRPLVNDETLTDHVTAWTMYFQRYCEERLHKGLFVEIGSPIYGKYFVPELVNIAEFAEDTALRSTATNLLHLTWAEWSIDQLNGIRGGGKTRSYQGKYSRIGTSDSWYHMGRYLLAHGDWTYTGFTQHPIHGANLILATSTYDIPDIVHKLAGAPHERGEYAYISRRPGKMSALDSLPPKDNQGSWYNFDPDDSQVVRYSWCTPNYIMGSFFTNSSFPAKHNFQADETDAINNSYAAIHAQNRWQGIIFDTHPNARIYPQCIGAPDKANPGLSKTYLQQSAIQHENVLIVQMGRASKHLSAMRIYFAPGMRERVQRFKGRYVIEEGDSYAAVRVVSRGNAKSTGSSTWEDDTFLLLSAPYDPVVFVTGLKSRFSTLKDFEEYIYTHSYTIEKGYFRYQFRDSQNEKAILRLNTREAGIPSFNNIPINLSPQQVYSSPFIQSASDAKSIRIQFRGDFLDLK